MKVFKFGGTSVGTPENIARIIDIVSKEAEEVVLVVSALGGLTDQFLKTIDLAYAGNEDYKIELKQIKQRHRDTVDALIDDANKERVHKELDSFLGELSDLFFGVFLIRGISLRTQDFILSFGERMSSFIIHEAFKSKGIEAANAGADTMLKTNSEFSNAIIDQQLTQESIDSWFAQNTGKVKVLPGFVAQDYNGDFTTLGRGGSDYTAAIVAAAIKASMLEIWTDVSGVLTADPRKVKNALPVTELSYEEAMELSYFGAKVIYPPTIQPVLKAGIPIKIKNTFEPEHEGTLITKNPKQSDLMVKGFSSVGNISLVTVFGSGMVGAYGMAMRLFSALAREKINVIMITQASSEHSICVGIDAKDEKFAKAVLEEEFYREIASKKIEGISIQNDLSIVAVVGENMKKTPGIAGKVFTALGGNGVNVIAIAQGTSELNISFVVHNDDVSRSLSIIHEALFLSNTKQANVFLVGVGTIGGTLIEQIRKQVDYLKDNLSVDVKVCGLINSKKMVINEEGINLDIWETELEEGNVADLEAYATAIKESKLQNRIFVDNTASDLVPSVYQGILDASVSIVTPNKVACSSDFAQYAALNATAKKRGVKYLYETNVGAGLPVISTLSDLVRSGDKVIKISAILSGTMNYLFNTVSANNTLSDTVKEAQDKGFAEPDPRIDLSGKDVARKILILAREAGLALEPDDIAIDSYLPDNILNSSSIDEFWENTKAYNADFETKRAAVEASGEKYRLAATLENGKAKVELITVNKEHAFYNCEGSDNVILFTTERYKENPLIIKGAGAGADVTAAGVFADIIRIVN